VLRELAAGRVVVVAGYQGEAPDGDVTTLGRGGSDTSAVALAAALEALRCEIYSDVQGVFSADPRIVDDAQLLDRVTYDEMIAFAHSGASVLDRRAVEHAATHRVELHARPAFGAGAGTVIGPPLADASEAQAGDGHAPVTGVAGHRQLLRLRFRDDGGDEGLARELEAAVGVSALPFSAESTRSSRTLLFPADELPASVELAADLGRSFERDIQVDDGLGSVSVIGLGIGGCESRRRRTRQVTVRHRIPVDDEHAVDHAYTLLVERSTVLPAIRSIHDALVPADGASPPPA